MIVVGGILCIALNRNFMIFIRKAYRCEVFDVCSLLSKNSKLTIVKHVRLSSIRMLAEAVRFLFACKRVKLK